MFKKILFTILVILLATSCSKKPEVTDEISQEVSQAFKSCELTLIPADRDVLGFFYNGNYYIMDSNVFVDPEALEEVSNFILDKKININDVIRQDGCIELEEGNYHGDLLQNQHIFTVKDDPEKIAVCNAGSCQLFSKYSADHLFYNTPDLGELLSDASVLYLFDKNKYITQINSIESSVFIPQVVPVDTLVLIKTKSEKTKWFYYRYAAVEGEDFIEISDDINGVAYTVKFSGGLKN